MATGAAPVQGGFLHVLLLAESYRGELDIDGWPGAQLLLCGYIMALI